MGLVCAVAVVLVIGIFAIVTRSELTWEVELDGANEVRDADADRILVETFDDELVVLDREDGAELGRFDFGSEVDVDEVGLVPGGLVLQSRAVPDFDDSVPDDQSSQLRLVDNEGELVWTHDEASRLALLGLVIDDGVAAISTAGGSLVGLDLADGEVRWRRDLTDPRGVPPTSGPLLREVAVVLGRGKDATEIVSLGDGASLGTSPTVEDASVAYWHDVVLTLAEGKFGRWVAGREAPLEDDELPTDPGLLGHVSGGAVGFVADGQAWGIDLEAGTVAPTPVEGTDNLDAGRTTGVIGEDGLVVADLGTGEVLLRRDADRADVAVLTTGTGSVLMVDALGWPTALRHGITGDEAGRVFVLDREGDEHGAFYSRPVDVIDFTVLDQHEAVIVTKQVGDRGADRVILMGR
ncbi:hypothetical protein BH09ACT12_BH09ACT12_35300 [soil metagenome]